MNLHILPFSFFVFVFVCLITACQQTATNPPPPSADALQDSINPFNNFPLLIPPIDFNKQMLLSLKTKPPIEANFAQKYLTIKDPKLPIYAIGRINMADTALALVYGEISTPNKTNIKLTLLDKQNRATVTYIIAQQQNEQLTTATLNRQLEITTNRQYKQTLNQKSTTTDSTIYQTFVLGEPIYTIPIDTINIGNLNNDKTADYAYIIPPVIRVPYNENPNFFICDPEPCQLQIKFSAQNITPLQHLDAFAAKIQTIGDLNNDGIQEIALVQGKDWNSWHDIFIYTYQTQNNPSWKLLDSIRTFNLEEKLIKHIKKINNKEFKLVGETFNDKTGLFSKKNKYVRF